MDKKVKAGSVAIGICLLVIAVLLFGIVYFFYNANMEKNNLQAKINELETTIKEKDNKVSELENKISKVSDVVNDEEKLLTEEEAKKLIKEKYELARNIFNLNISKFNEFTISTQNTKIDGDLVSHYKILNFEEVFNKYFTQNIKKEIKENSCILFINDEAYQEEGLTPPELPPFNGVEFEKIEVTDKDIKCNAKIECVRYDEHGNKILDKYENYNFSLVKENKNWKIDSYIHVF